MHFKLIQHTDVKNKQTKKWLPKQFTTYKQICHLRHQDFNGTLGVYYACDAVYALFQTAFAVCHKKFLLEVSNLGIPVEM